MMTQTMAPAPIRPKAAPSLTHTLAPAKSPQTQPAAPARPATPPAEQTAPSPRRESDSRVELVQLNDETWRVCDATGTPGQRGYIVGYLQRCGTEYEMLWMHPRPGVVHRHADFDEAFRAISTRLSMSAR